MTPSIYTTRQKQSTKESWIKQKTLFYVHNPVLCIAVNKWINILIKSTSLLICRSVHLDTILSNKHASLPRISFMDSGMVSSGWVSNLPSIQLIINFTAKNQSQGKNAPVVCLLCWFGTITVSHRLQRVTETLKKVEWPSGWGTRDMSFKFQNSSQYFIINWSALLTYKLGLKPPDSRGFSGFHFQSDSAGAPPSCLRL